MTKGTKRRYTIKGSVWTQRELTFGEDVVIRKFLKDKLDQLDKLTDPTVASILGFLLDSNALVDFFQLILVPYEPTPFHKLWNRLCMVLHGVDRKEIAWKMYNSEIAKVIDDFFFLNASWLAGYLNFANSSLLNMPEIPILKGLISLKNPLYYSRTVPRN